jgi:hypothetical protein
MLLLQRSGQWLHVLNVARFVHAAEHGRQANVCYAVYEEGSGAADTVDLLCSGDIAAGEEVVACCRPGGLRRSVWQRRPHPSCAALVLLSTARATGLQVTRVTMLSLCITENSNASVLPV